MADEEEDETESDDHGQFTRLTIEDMSPNLNTSEVEPETWATRVNNPFPSANQDPSSEPTNENALFQSDTVSNNEASEEILADLNNISDSAAFRESVIEVSGDGTESTPNSGQKHDKTQAEKIWELAANAGSTVNRGVSPVPDPDLEGLD